MQVKILFDKEALNRNLYTGWGISFLIENRILFDTGENGEWLINNIQQLGLEIDRLQAIVISHDHWDHTGGLWEILKRKKLKVYGCPNFSQEFKIRVRDLGSEFIGLNRVTKISPRNSSNIRRDPAMAGQGIYLTGEIPGLYAGTDIAEQAVIIKTANGLSVLTGCSHPGVIKILKKIKSEFPKQKLYLVVGGFHLIEQDARLIKIIVDEFRKLQVNQVGPTHCTGKEAEEIFKAEYKNDFISIRVGQILEV
jgi:7,8-dihydropterin-6-yl-methyl-4-(beta-D-ribofuranosyl)aminobenzene 5'-phosphate synthase